jgi:hypothetical protein
MLQNLPFKLFRYTLKKPRESPIVSGKHFRYGTVLLNRVGQRVSHCLLISSNMAAQLTEGNYLAAHMASRLATVPPLGR